MNQLLPIGLKTSLKRHSVPIRFGLPTSFIFRARKKVGFIWPLKWICAPSESRAGSWTIRWPSAPALHHSDRGVQYAAQDFRQTLKIYDVSPSMSRKACCYDNAAMESFFATLKTECFQNRIPKNRAQAGPCSSITSKLSTIPSASTRRSATFSTQVRKTLE
jgi:transposase InsO family protein